MTEELRINKIQIDITFTKETTNIPVDVQIRSSIDDFKDQKIDWAYSSACNAWKNVHCTTFVFKTREEAIKSMINDCLEESDWKYVDCDDNSMIDGGKIEKFLMNADKRPIGIAIDEEYMYILHTVGTTIDLWRMSDYKNIKLSECLKV